MTTAPDTRTPLRSGVPPWGRVAVALLTAALLAISLPRLGGALWSTVRTWLAVGEIEVTLPASVEIVEHTTTGDAPSVTILHGNGVMADLTIQVTGGSAAHVQLTLARALTALVLLTLVVLVATLGARVALNRSVFRLLVRGSAVCGTLLLVVPVVASILEARALRTFAEALRTERGVTSIFPDDVEVALHQGALAGALLLLVLAFVLRAAERDADELRDLV